MKRKSLNQLQREADKADDRMADSAIVITIVIVIFSILYNCLN
mgnify:FL=1|jgi:hypothetical protein